MISHKKNARDIIIVNATALISSGALTILNQFLEHAATDLKHNYLCFVHEDINKVSNGNISIVHIKAQTFISRVYWDLRGVNLYLKKEKIKPKKIISLQNTSVSTDFEQIIYLHQPIPFSDFNIKFRYKYSRFLMYKYLYSFFIFFRTKKTIFVVQTDWMKKAIIKKKRISQDRVFVIKPEISIPVITNFQKLKKSHNGIRLLYPATNIFYKNHIVILEALRSLKKKGILGNLKFQVTFKYDGLDTIVKKITKYGLEDNIEYLGVLPYEELFIKYIQADAILFPSYLESFGLPLAESAMLGKYIICSDLPFANDVLNGYTNVDYVTHDDVHAWELAIKNIIFKIRDDNFVENKSVYKHQTSWADFFKLI